jgi:hypothetical protein
MRLNAARCCFRRNAAGSLRPSTFRTSQRERPALPRACRPRLLGQGFQRIPQTSAASAGTPPAACSLPRFSRPLTQAPPPAASGPVLSHSVGSGRPVPSARAPQPLPPGSRPEPFSPPIPNPVSPRSLGLLSGSPLISIHSWLRGQAATCLAVARRHSADTWFSRPKGGNGEFEPEGAFKCLHEPIVSGSRSHGHTGD